MENLDLVASKELENRLSLRIFEINFVTGHVDLSQMLVAFEERQKVLQRVVRKGVARKVHFLDLATLDAFQEEFQVLVHQLLISQIQTLGGLDLTPKSLDSRLVQKALMDKERFCSFLHFGKIEPLRVVLVAVFIVLENVPFDGSDCPAVRDDSFVVRNALRLSLSRLVSENLFFDILQLGLAGAEKRVAGVRFSDFEHRPAFSGNWRKVFLLLFGEADFGSFLDAEKLRGFPVGLEVVEEDLLLDPRFLLRGKHRTLEAGLKQLNLAFLQRVSEAAFLTGPKGHQKTLHFPLQILGLGKRPLVVAFQLFLDLFDFLRKKVLFFELGILVKQEGLELVNGFFDGFVLFLKKRPLLVLNDFGTLFETKTELL